MKMLLLRVIVTLLACWVVKCDLLDLYVQHMDETMKTYKNKQHPMDPVSRRIKRSFEKDEPLLRIGNFKKQRLDVDENWLKQWKAKRKIIPYKSDDGLDYSNKREENLSPDQHEIFSNIIQKSKDFKKTTAIPKDNTENSLNISQHPIIEERQKTSKVELTTVESQINVKESIVEDLEPEKGVPEESWRDFEGTENEDNSQFEIISENDRIDPKPFVGPSFKRKPWSSQVPKKYFSEKPAKDAKSYVKDVKGETKPTRSRRSITHHQEINEGTHKHARVRKFTRYEKLDENGDVILEWDPSDEEDVIFRVTAKTLGYIGIGFNEKTSMKGADILLAWVDDHTGAVNLLDSYGIEMNAAPLTDVSQDVQVLSGLQNATHTTVTFTRKWQTCDPQDHRLTGDTIRVLWALHDIDPELNTAMWHGYRRGGKALRLKAAAAHSPPRQTHNIRHWDVKLNQFEVENTDTVYWCKIFKATSLKKKHHMIGYTPLVEKANEDLVHHIILYECASTEPILGEHARITGTRCYSPTMPRAWDSCLQPVLAWARGSKGEWMPEHVGIPIAENGENSYYMLEVHYNNPTMKRVIDSSGIRLHLTSQLRPQEAGILVAGVAVSPLHLVPPQRKEYATAGYCTPHCTNTMLPENGINVVSVVLHSHLAGRRLTLKHIRRGKELPRIVQDNHFDFDYQQSHTLEKEVKILPGDELIAECIYGTLDRKKPTLGGYAASQEMCLAFVMHYPRTPLAACYSMTPVKDLFRTLGINSFRGLTMDYLEKLFLTNGSDLISPVINQQQLSAYSTMKSTELDKAAVKEAESALRAMREHTEENEDDNIFARLIIEDPEEFRGRTMTEHMLALPWTEDLLTRSIEDNLYHGRHMTFCRKRDDQLALPADIQNFPNFTALPETNDTVCSDLTFTYGSSGASYTYLINMFSIVVVSIVTIVVVL
ncbi:MOXD1 homolog 1 [Monomorium pharaonis]|uniref:MOXD1 homolog 1 n=1 Tax=Monomorium pharaonis TaxID=307658 RepID=UPI00063F990E|nr:MOXD1 homolog 1 [Monomorium pharaonis]